MGEEIEFFPTEADVVSTKLRTWNLKHPGNLFYTEMVHRRVSEYNADDHATSKRVASEIVNTILNERGGRFLKLRDGDLRPTHCTVMPFKQCIAKVTHALRTAQARLEGRSPNRSKSGDASAKKKNIEAKSARSSSKRPNNDRKSTSPRPRSRRPSVGEPIAYVATPNRAQPIHQYILDAISLVCNQSDASTAYRALDSPLGGYTLESEPDKERLMRLGLRLRFASAASIRMGPLEFATKLLKLWGGKLAVKKMAHPGPSARTAVSKPLATPAAGQKPPVAFQPLTPATASAISIAPNPNPTPLLPNTDSKTPTPPNLQTMTPSTAGLPGVHPSQTPMSAGLPTPRVLSST